jgi:hypothetical protein
MFKRVWRYFFPVRTKIRVFLKSGNYFDMEVEKFKTESNLSSGSVTGWEATWVNTRNRDRIVTLPPGNIEGVLELRSK